ncbi:MAG: hypothetical protein LC777_16435, partial [Actinobacteria bacterium]|nr:hypothetical protein [Actinomycetota bacterium]
MSDYVTRCNGSDPVRVSVDTDADTEVSVDGQGFRKGRFEQAVSLQAGQAFSFSTRDAGGERTHHVRCLPSGFPAWSFDRQGEPSQDWYVISPLAEGSNYVIFLDGHGVPVWWLKGVPPAIDAKVLSDGNLAFGTYYGGEYATNPA